jgi:hypothetical protein
LAGCNKFNFPLFSYYHTVAALCRTFCRSAYYCAKLLSYWLTPRDTEGKQEKTIRSTRIPS